jgi:hypothetical protein
LIDLHLEGRNDVVAHDVDLVLPKEMGMEGAIHLPSFWVTVNFFTCCHTLEVKKRAWGMAQTFFESVRKVGTKGP